MTFILPSIGSGIIASPIATAAPAWNGNTYSVDLDGTDEAVETTYSPTVGSTAFTATMWIKSSNTTTNQGFISNLSSSSVHNLAVLSPSSTHSFFVIINNGSTQSVINGIGGTNSTLDIRDGNWHHLAITVNGTSVKIYKDGGDAAINTSNPTNTQGTPFGTWTSGTSYIGKAQNFWFGTNGSLSYSSGNRYYLDGNIDEAAVWESELSGSDISAIYNSGLPNDISSYSPVGWWRMGDNDSGTGTTVTDQGSGGNDATLDNGASFSTIVPTYSTYSVEFDGSNDYVEVGNVSGLSGTSFSISAWFYLTAGPSGEGIFGAGSSPSDRIWLQVLDSDTIRFGSIGNINTFDLASGTFSLNTWYHVVGVIDGTSKEVFINGSSLGTTTVSSLSGTNGNNVRIGSLPSQTTAFNALNPYQGILDEVAVFNTALSSTNVSSIYNSGVPNDISSLNPVGWWRMGDNDGGTGTTITDQGSGGNNGTLTNGPTFSTTVP